MGVLYETVPTKQATWTWKGLGAVAIQTYNPMCSVRTV